MRKSWVDFFHSGRTYGILLAIFLTVGLSEAALGQKRFGLKFRPGVSFVTTKIPQVSLHEGYGFEGTVSYRLFPHISVYGGWGWNLFSARRSFAGDDVELLETGYGMGLQLFYPLADDAEINYFFRGGLIINNIELQDSRGRTVADSGSGPGFQVEAGVCFPVSEQLHLIPGIKYQSLSREIPFQTNEFLVDLNYLSVGVHISWTP